MSESERNGTIGVRTRLLRFSSPALSPLHHEKIPLKSKWQQVSDTQASCMHSLILTVLCLDTVDSSSNHHFHRFHFYVFGKRSKGSIYYWYHSHSRVLQLPYQDSRLRQCVRFLFFFIQWSDGIAKSIWWQVIFFFVIKTSYGFCLVLSNPFWISRS